MIINLVSSTAQNNNPLEITIIKKEIQQKAGDLGFNVITFKNKTNNPLKFKPTIELPKNWNIFSNNFSDTTIAAGEVVNFPVRFKSSGESLSEITYNVIVNAFIDSPKIIQQDSFSVTLDKYHNWDLQLPDKRAFFYPEKDDADFNVRLVNQGNTPDTIELSIKSDNRIDLTGFASDGEPVKIILQPKTDTTLLYSAHYTYSKDRVFDLNKVKIMATASDKKIIRTVILEKYSDKYSPFDIDKTLSHETELGLRSFSNNNEILPFIRARGVSSFKNESKFRYNFTYYDLTNNEDFISNSYYNLLYTWDDFKVGVGAFSSSLGRNLYSRNCLMVSNTFTVDENSAIEGYASYGIVSPKANLAAAYRFDNDKFNMQASASFDIDNFHNRNTASAVYKTGRISILKNQDIKVSLYGYSEKFDVENPYQQTGYAWDISYFGTFGKNLSVQFTNNYGSPNIPGPQMGLVSYYGKLNYRPRESKNHITITYINSKRNYYFYDSDGIKLPNIKLSDQYVNLLYHFDANKKIRFYIGPSVEYYSSSQPIPDSPERMNYDVNKYRIEFKGYFGRNIMGNLKYGLGIMSPQKPNDVEESVHDFHVLGEYNNNGYGVRLAYDYGPMVNMGLYQYALDAGNHSMSISPYVLRSYLKGRIGVSLFTNYTHRFDLNYSSLNINPKIETYLYRNWYAVLGGTYTFTNQKYSEIYVRNSFHYIEFSVKKRWGNSDYYSWRKELRRLKIQLFRDENGNGKMDRGEKGIPEVKIRILLTNTADQKARESFPVDITLMSNDKGIVTFNRIPRGFYKLSIIPLSDLKEYFYVNSSSNTIELMKNSSLSIPFQKSDKIIGKVEIVRRKFVSKNEETIDMANVKVTAYNEKGDSYSSLTRADGSFTIFAPGNNVYYVRIKNVFGDDFMIMNNDSRRMLVDSVTAPVEIRVVEKSRKVNFKKATTASETSPHLQKVKVLPGKIYKNSDNRPVDPSASPDFEHNTNNANIIVMNENSFYLTIGNYKEIQDAKKAVLVLKEQGIKCSIGIYNEDSGYYVIIKEVSSRNEANNLRSRYLNSGISPVSVIKFKIKNK